MSMESELANHLAQLNLQDRSDNDLVQQLTQALLAQIQVNRQQQQPAEKLARDPRPADPPKFNGTSLQETPDFLASVHNIFNLCPNTYKSDAQKIGYVGSLLIGSARTWFRLQSESTQFPNLTFVEFEVKLKTRFGDPFAKVTAQRKLHSLRQGTRSALTYSTEFHELAQEAEFNDSAMISGFYSGLREDVKDALAPIRDLPTTFLEYSQVVVSIDNRLFERRQEKLGRPSFGMYAGKPSSSDKTPSSVKGSSALMDDPMEVDVAQWTSRSESDKQGERNRRRRLGLCYYCGGKGHLASGCPKISNKATATSSYLRLRIPLELTKSRMSVLALLDSGATGNFMDKAFATRLGLALKKKNMPTSISLADGTVVRDHITEEVTIPIAIQHHMEEATFDIGSFPKNPVILGMPWLTRHNPAMDFRNKILTFVPQYCKSCQVDRSLCIPLQTEDTKINPIVTNAAHTVDAATVPLFDDSLPGPNRDSRMGDEGILLPGEVNTEGNCMPDESPRISEFELGPPKLSHVSEISLPPEQTYSEKIPTVTLPPNVPDCYRDLAKVFSKSHANVLPEQRPYDCPIDLKENAVPPFKPLYNLTQPEMKALQTYIQENLEKKFIQPSRSPAGAPIFFVTKKDGDLRPCVDYRGLNAITIKNRYPLPLLDNMIDQLRGAKFFTKLDLRGAYNLVRVREGDEWKTAFRCRYGHYEYKVMPFGLTNAPAVFQGMMNDILAEFLDRSVINYLDDILIYSADLETHKTHVRQVLERLLENQLYVKAEKCAFHQKEVTFLGFVIYGDGVRMDPDKTAAIKDWVTPTSLSKLRRFLGFANFYRRFVPNYSTLASPLTSLTSTAKPFMWNDEATKAFEVLKQALQNNIVLRYPDYSKPFVVQTDASDVGIGAVLLQDNQPISFYSRKLSDAEINYAVYDKELLAIVAAFTHWRHHLVGASVPITVQSDHQNLRYFATKQILNQRHARWAVLLSEFDFRIEFLPGKNNESADALSRSFDSDAENEGSILLREECWKDIATVDVVTDTRTLVEEDACKLEIVKARHDSVTAGHLGIRKTRELVARDFVWPGMRKYIADYVASCEVCQRNKVDCQKPFGLLHPLPIPQQPWKSVSMDFIVKLPVSEGFDSIMVVVDRLTKQAHFVPCREEMDAEETANLYLTHIFKLHGLPEDIISDRGPQFKSHFWKALWTILGTTPKLSSSYHPETDGQTERVNQTLEQFLRNYISGQHHDWVSLLPFAEFAYNNAEHVALGCSPFFANYQFNPRADYCSPLSKDESSVPAVTARVKLFYSTLAAIRHNLRQAQEDAKKFADLHRRPVSFSVGDKVWLSSNNLRVSNRKFASKFLGPFTITSVVNDAAFRLSLPEKMMWHNNPYWGASSAKKASCAS
jgi:hypothetical protein